MEGQCGMRNCFHGADILLPQKISMKKWAVVACDQFSSQPEYWRKVAGFVADAPSTYHMIYPEALLGSGYAEERIASMHRAMETYLQIGLFRTLRRGFIYLERRLPGGGVRRGLVGQVDLEEYDFVPGSGARIRATEETVQERIPPRVKLLENAALEFPHTLLLSDDRSDAILRAAATVRGERVYHFDLMEDGGHITGWAVSGMGVSIVNRAVTDYIAGKEAEGGMAFVVGDGNHSLAAAKACWEKLKSGLTAREREGHPARFALAELENIHDEAVSFTPIHRVLKGVSTERFLAELRRRAVAGGCPITCVTAAGEETVYLSRAENPLAVAILQPFLDDYTARHGGVMDYIHGEDVVRMLAAEQDTVGLILPGIEKEGLFPGILQGGVLPRKTFSMGQAREKRYYLEGKRRK